MNRSRISVSGKATGSGSSSTTPPRPTRLSDPFPLTTKKSPWFTRYCDASACVHAPVFLTVRSIRPSRTADIRSTGKPSGDEGTECPFTIGSSSRSATTVSIHPGIGEVMLWVNPHRSRPLATQRPFGIPILDTRLEHDRSPLLSFAR
ncbi:hypothetical protein DSECCO2_614840 [anaerobic digester metagenome]